MGKGSDKAPAYQWFPKDAETDEAYRLMTYEQQGIYRALLDHQWLQGSLPKDPAVIAKLLPKVHPARFLRLWVGIAPCFAEEGDRLVNPKLEKQRSELATYIAERRLSGSRGAQKRWLSDGSAITQPLANDSSASATASPSPIQQHKERVVVASAPTARSKRPIYQSDRFVVFEWMLDDLGRMLGSHVDDFDLHSFFDDLSQHSRKTGLVIPREHAWQWLQGEVLKEAQRRRLPIAGAETSAAAMNAGVMELLRKEGAIS